MPMRALGATPSSDTASMVARSSRCLRHEDKDLAAFVHASVQAF